MVHASHPALAASESTRNVPISPDSACSVHSGYSTVHIQFFTLWNIGRIWLVATTCLICLLLIFNFLLDILRPDDFGSPGNTRNEITPLTNFDLMNDRIWGHDIAATATDVDDPLHPLGGQSIRNQDRKFKLSRCVPLYHFFISTYFTCASGWWVVHRGMHRSAPS